MIAKRIDNGVVEFVNKKNYWTNKKKYKVFGRRSAPQIFDSSIVDRIEKKADLGNLLILLVYIDNDNMICRYDKHEEKLMGIHDLQGFCNLLKMKERATRDFLKKMMELGIVKKITIAATATEKSYDKFYINPVITMRERAVSLPLYKLFQESLDAVLPPTAISDLQEAWQAEFEGRPLQQRKIDVSVLADDDVKEIPDDFLSQLQMDPEVVEIDNAKLKARAAEFNPFLTAKADDIAKEYICGQQPQLYAMANGGSGMVKTDYSDDKDIYFAVNTPAEYHDKKPKNSDIVNYNAWYVDIDAGKDENGHYFTVAEVEKRKEMMRNVIDLLPTPTYVNSTRNGYHIYFACDSVNNEEEWRKVENKLAEIVTIADKAVKDPARLMRLPGSWWHKNDKSAAEGCESYRCRPLVANRVKYTAAELLAKLDKVVENVKAACDTYIKAFNVIEGKRSNKNAQHVNVDVECNARIADIRSLTTTTFVIPAAVTIVDNAKNWLRQQSLAEFLQIANPNSFACVFHNDEHPSATIYHNESGDRYVCAAASCSVSSHGWDIVDCVMALANCDFVTALKYLTTIYNIKEG